MKNIYLKNLFEIIDNPIIYNKENINKFHELIKNQPSNFWGKFPNTSHITASCLVFDNEFENVLLTNHKKLNKWLQLGGHWCDFESEPNQFILDCAIKEVEEEAFGDKKIEQEILFNNNAVDLDIHSVGSHFHYDICFASIVKKTIPIVVSNESLDVKWLNIDMVLENNYELRLNYLVLKNEDSCFIGNSPRLLG